MARYDLQVNVRMPDELKQALEKAAHKQRRTLTAEIVMRLQESIEKEESEKDTARLMKEAAAEFRAACAEIRESRALYCGPGKPKTGDC